MVLVIKGPKILPLKPKYEKYFGRQLRDVRSKMNGTRDNIQSAVWQAEYQKNLKKYPDFRKVRMSKLESYCNAFNRNKQACDHEAWLRGSPYDPRTHEDVVDTERERLRKLSEKRKQKQGKKGSEEDSDSSDDDDPREIGPLGNTCMQRSMLYHDLHHWEHKLFKDIHARYHDLLRTKGEDVGDSDSLASDDSDASAATAGEKNRLKRARDNGKKRVAEFRRKQHGPLPENVDDTDEVTEWMANCGYQAEALAYINRLERRARALDQHL